MDTFVVVSSASKICHAVYYHQCDDNGAYGSALELMEVEASSGELIRDLSNCKSQSVSHTYIHT